MPQHPQQLALVAQPLDRLTARVEPLVEHLDGDLVADAASARHRGLVDLSEAATAQAGVYVKLSDVFPRGGLAMVFHSNRVRSHPTLTRAMVDLHPFMAPTHPHRLDWGRPRTALAPKMRGKPCEISH